MLLKDQLAGLHADKLVGVIETHLSDGRADAVRQALPGLMTMRPEVRERLAPILERLRANAPSAPETIVDGSATALACGACGGALVAQSPDSTSVVCPYCGTTNDVGSGALGHRWGAAVDPEARFRIGTFLTLDGTRWQAVGMQHFSGTVREWDTEDDAWETNHAEYTTWWMMDARRRIEYLVDDGAARWWSAAYVPDDPALPSPSARGVEHGSFELVDVAGELSYRAVPGERHETVERYSGGTGTSAERRLGPDGEPVEIGFYRERRIDDEELVEALGDPALLAPVRTWRRRSAWFLVAAATCALGYVALGLTFASERAFDEVVGTATANALGGAGDVGVPLGSFETTGPLPTHRLVLEGGPLPENSSLFVSVRLSSPEAGVDAVVPLELWHETGRDSDGFWRETEYRAARSLRLPVPGRYEVHAMDAELPAGVNGARLVIETNDRRPLPVVVGVIVALLLCLGMRLRANAVLTGLASIAHVPHSGAEPPGSRDAPAGDGT